MMFDHVLQALPPQVVMHGSELIWQRPSDKYDVLKAALIYRFSDSESRHFEQVIHHLELDDSKPSHLLRHIQQILGCESTNNPRFICHMFLSRLPHQACCVLAAHTNSELTQLAATADMVLEANMAMSAGRLSATSVDRPHPTVAQQFFCPPTNDDTCNRMYIVFLMWANK